MNKKVKPYQWCDEEVNNQSHSYRQRSIKLFSKSLGIGATTGGKSYRTGDEEDAPIEDGVEELRL